MYATISCTHFQILALIINKIFVLIGDMENLAVQILVVTTCI